MQSVPVQSWNFEHESVIRIGRSTDNHVILYSAVVSRHHVEIRKSENGWEIINLGANGTYVDGRRVTQVPVEDGVIIRLARSGPNVQIHLNDRGLQPSSAGMGENTVGQEKKVVSPSIAPTRNPDLDDASALPAEAAILAPPRSGLPPYTAVEVDDELTAIAAHGELAHSACCQQYVDSEYLFCLVCGKPLREIGVAGNYHLLKEVERNEVSKSYLAWRDGQTFILQTLLPEWLEHPDACRIFEQEARTFLAIDHPMLPHFRDVFSDQGQPYLVMEPVYGRSLAELVATEGPLTVSQAIAYLQDICQALDYLHQNEPPILHQRINPAYLVQRLDPSASLVVTGLMPGRSLIPSPETAAYTAPEQQHGEVSPTSDLYALGPTLAYLLTGKSPESFYAHREQGFRFYAEYVPGLTADLVAIMRKLTNPAPGDRFSQIKDLREALQHVITSSVEIN